jgi:NADH-quinone oxidoreductase subunit C
LTSNQPDSTTTREEWAIGLADRLGGEAVVEFDTARIYVGREKWLSTIRRARDEEGLDFFSWLTAVDWSREVTVGEGAEDADALEERFDVMCRLSSTENADAAHFVAVVPKDDAAIDSLVPLFAGAEWHEREARDMFGIDFPGNPNLVNIYLPDEFVGNPLLKSFPLLSRDVKPWPGAVDVEGMPGDDDDAEEAGE